MRYFSWNTKKNCSRIAIQIIGRPKQRIASTICLRRLSDFVVHTCLIEATLSRCMQTHKQAAGNAILAPMSNFVAKDKAMLYEYMGR